MNRDNYSTQKRTGKKLCAQCKSRPTAFSPKGGKYRSDSDHDLCNQCWRSVLDQIRLELRIISLTAVSKHYHHDCCGIILPKYV